jgi:hypothetical protein
VTAIIVLSLLAFAFRYHSRIALPITWPWTMLYAAGIVGIAELIFLISKRFDPKLPLHLEVLLPAFALGCVLKSPSGQDPHCDDATEGVEPGPESQREQFVSTIVSACFMLLVGLSMPSLITPAAAQTGTNPGSEWSTIALHAAVITVLSNLGKMFPVLFYRREATRSARLALAIAMFPRGEVGAGVLLIAIRYGCTGPAVTVAVLSLAANLALTGVFIFAVKRLIASSKYRAREA